MIINKTVFVVRVGKDEKHVVRNLDTAIARARKLNDMYFDDAARIDICTETEYGRIWQETLGNWWR